MARDAAYREAEKKIDQARRSRAKVLNLQSMNLTTVPDSIGQLIPSLLKSFVKTRGEPVVGRGARPCAPTCEDLISDLT